MKIKNHCTTESDQSGTTEIIRAIVLLNGGCVLLGIGESVEAKETTVCTIVYSVHEESTEKRFKK